MSVPLFDRARHEPLSADAWSEAHARAWIERIADDANACFSSDAFWPAHPLDLDGERPREPFTTLYFGAAGVVWALDALHRTGFASAPHDWSALLPAIAERNRVEVERMASGDQSLLMGRSGIALLDYRLHPDAARADRVAQSIARNAAHPSNELMWGVPGTLHAALAMHEATGEARWADLFRAGAASLWDALDYDAHAHCNLWTQHLYGQRCRYLGAAHGFAGNAGVVVRGLALFDEATRSRWIDALVDTLVRTAVRDGALASWPPLQEARPATKMLVQWCHGAPGVVACVAGLDDLGLDALLVAAGELTWAAGPLAKGAGLCHGTAGNGFALLKLHRRTGDSRWLDRARAFAMHAIAQSDRDATRYRRRRYSLWTGDQGVALYVAACIDGHSAMPMVDPEPLAPAR